MNDRTEQSWKAEAINRGGMLLKLRETLIALMKDGLEDDGDRVYLASTNYADDLRAAIQMLDDFGWSQFMKEKSGETDYIAELKAANQQLASLRGRYLRTKFLEIRDKHTFVPAVAIDCSLSGNSFDDYLLRRAGYGARRMILLTRLDGHGKAHYDPYGWADRTWTVAHQYIAKKWDEIADAEVIDVEWILGETESKKASERYTEGAVLP